MLEKMENAPGARILFVLACLVVVVYGLRLLASILLPFSLALFLAVLTLPILYWLKRKGVWSPIAILLAAVVPVAVFGLIVLLASQSVDDLQVRLPIYAGRLQEIYLGWMAELEARGLPVGDVVPADFINLSAIVDLAGGTIQRAATFLSSTFLVLIIMVFILAEASIFPAKFRAIFGGGADDEGRFTKIIVEVQEYLGIKTLMSLATGILIGLWAWIMGLDFPVLLGLLGFLLNYVPTIGSVMASIPAMLLALVTTGVAHALVVGIGYAVINMIFGNFIEPNLLGRRLGLSTLIVLLSLLFWGWVWGPVGMLLSVPLTMITKIMLENTEDLHWIAILLDKTAPDPMPTAAKGGD